MLHKDTMKDTNAPTWVFRSLPSSRCLLSTAWRQHIVFIMPVSSAGICLIARPGGNIGRKCCLEFCFVYLQSIMIFLLFLVIIIIFTSLRPSQEFLGRLYCLVFTLLFPSIYGIKVYEIFSARSNNSSDRSL